MKKIIILILFQALSINSFSQEKDYWLLSYDDDGQSCGYIDRDSNIMIPFHKYSFCFTDTFRSLAIVYNHDVGYVGIDKSDSILFEVYPFDNGPDYYYSTNGTFRIIKNSKVGIADTSGAILIPPIYDFTFGLEDEIAIVNYGGHEEPVNPSDPNCEYHRWVGGRWGIVDANNEIILDLKYELSYDSIDYLPRLSNRKESYKIVKGEIIKE